MYMMIVVIALLCYLVMQVEPMPTTTHLPVPTENASEPDPTIQPRLTVQPSNSTYGLLFPLGRGVKDQERGAGSHIDQITYCKRPARCEPLQFTTCMGTKLPYSQTTLDTLDGLFVSQQDVQEKLEQWQNLRNLPKCWAVIQPLLCAVYMPKCEDGMVTLPSQEMCKVTRSPCSTLEKEYGWPSYLRCDNLQRFPSLCKNDVRELKFNNSARCVRPLVEVDTPHSYYEGFEGCSLQCDNPLFTPEELEQIRGFISIGGGICLACTIFAVLTFMIEWKSARKYPGVIIFYINGCFLIACIGWLVQFTSDTRRNVVCKKDGTLRNQEPSGGQNMSCVVVFIVVYYFMIAAAMWFVMLTYSWDISFKALGKVREHIDKKAAYFHLISWSIPLVLTITTMAMGEVDADSVTGICFVSATNLYVRVAFLLVPIGIALIVGYFFLARGLVTLVKLRVGSRDLISETASAKIHSRIIRMGLVACVSCSFFVVTLVCHVYEYNNWPAWQAALRKYIICESMLTEALEDMPGEGGPCRLRNRPNPSMVELHLLAMFGSGILQSSWVWTKATVDAWKRMLRRRFRREEYEDQPVKVKKHKVIAQAFAKRKNLNSVGRLSISFRSSHADPVGMNFDLSSAASQDVSSDWAAALPKFMSRRGAIIAASSVTNSLRRHSSADSSLSAYSIRRLSVDSHRSRSILSLSRPKRQHRRHSLDSLISLRDSDVVRLAAIHSRAIAKGNGEGDTAPTRRQRRGQRAMRVGPLFRRRRRAGSTTSHDSTIGSQSQVLPAITVNAEPESPAVASRRWSLSRYARDTDTESSLTFDPSKEIAALLNEKKEPLLRNGQTSSYLDEKLQQLLNQSYGSCTRSDSRGGRNSSNQVEIGSKKEDKSTQTVIETESRSVQVSPLPDGSPDKKCRKGCCSHLPDHQKKRRKRRNAAEASDVAEAAV